MRMSQGLLRVREAAAKDKSTRFTSLLHHITAESLEASYYALKRNAAPGVDGRTWGEYQSDIAERLENLHARIHRGSYRAQPSLRVYIPKSDGKKRPLGIASLEDKIVQQAVSEVLSVIYETEFYGFSYGFRPRRGCHDALDAIYVALTRKKLNYVLDADIQGFFDTISHEWIVRFLERRVADQRIIRLIRKWLRAGVYEEGVWTSTEVGTPQGAVISPLLANIFLHYVLDDWVVWWRRNQAFGDVVIVRYADDFVMGFQYKREAERFLKALRERLQAFALHLHPEKTRLIEFGKFAAEDRRKRGEGKPETFDFLGFTHICSTTWKDKYFKILRLTAKKRKREMIKRIGQILYIRMHDEIDEVGQWLQRVMQGYYQYFAVPDNTTTLSSIRHAITRSWFKVLCRRSQKRRIGWDTFSKIAKRWIPIPTPLHPYPKLRFCAKYS
jgi:group II intron reverse transcriptase/maturase